MDAEGLEAVTMRRVGRELGVEAMSLYNHVADKEDILHGVVEPVMAGFEFPEDDDDRRESARRAARAWRALLKAHPNVMTLMSHQREPMTSLVVLPHGARDRDPRARWPLGAGTVRAFRALGGYVQGFVLADIAQMFGGDDPEVDPDEVARNLPMDELPTLARHLDHLFRCDQDDEFEYGLDLMNRGLEAKATDGG